MAEMSGSKSVRSPASSLLNLERIAEESAASALKDFQKDVFQELECPVCLEIPVPPVILCKKGHFVCGTCRKKLTKCVICRGPYTNARNYAIEKIISKIEVKCKNKSCEEIVSVEKVGEHLKSCDCRPIVCNLDNGTVCQDKVINYDQYLEHLYESHSAGKSLSATIFEFGVTSSTRALINEGRNDSLAWPKIVFERDGATLILNMQVQEAFAYFWVTAMLPSVKVKNVVAALKIGECIKKDSKRRNVNWTIDILPVQMVLNEIKESGNCAAFPAKNLISLSGTNTADDEPFSFRVELELRRLRVQAPGRSVRFYSTTGTDTVMRNVMASAIDVRYQCITCMAEYADKSFEELRFEDYEDGRAGNYQPALFETRPRQEPTTVLRAASFTQSELSPRSRSFEFQRLENQSRQSTSTWWCTHCTFLNNGNNFTCDVCNLPRGAN